MRPLRVRAGAGPAPAPRPHSFEVLDPATVGRRTGRSESP
ncbi:hypothetical protein FTUN_4617 [Frigoriglobus tundricola]|uniref:Uncharacterized protein n=1 Tax=Frigoriglobus tundricola TaxID=2774151 RepID=A0A6M5YUT4_9BACT|nr:hypothetical protein FTUN_4617 [Frigoriglobus tundricola]